MGVWHIGAMAHIRDKNFTTAIKGLVCISLVEQKNRKPWLEKNGINKVPPIYEFYHYNWEVVMRYPLICDGIAVCDRVIQ